jgi:hypothetical protein
VRTDVHTAGTVYTIVANDLSDPVAGTFSGLAEGATINVGGNVFRISYAGGDGNDVTLTAIGPATHFTVSAPASATAGTALSFTVTARDPFNNVATSYGGTVHFMSSDGAATLPANSTLTNGVGTFSATLKTAGNQTITATDTVTASITGTSGPIAVGAAAATHFTISAPASAMLSPASSSTPKAAGTAFSFTVTALDQFNNTATGYAGTVHFTSSDPQATLPADSTLTNGTGTFTATLRTAGSQTITGTDTGNGSITGTSNAIVVSPAAATHFALSAPASVAGGAAFSFTVTALDPFNNVATGYAGTVHFTSSDAHAILPADSTLMNGVGTFSATLKTAGNQTLTASDIVNSAITGSATISSTAVPIPTLSTWAFLLLVLLLTLTALRALRAQRTF